MRWRGVRLCLIVVLCALGAGCAQGAERTHFVRLKAGKEAGTGTFQTAAVRYSNPATPVEVVLCAVVHVGDLRYFQKLRKRLDASALVLYEAVQVGTDEHPVPATDRWLDPAQALGNLLGLVHQATALDYRSAHFVWADVSLAELFRGGGPDLLESLLGGAPSTATGAIPGGVFSLLFLAMDPRRARAKLAGVLNRTFDDLPSLLGTKLSHSLIEMRNQKVLSVLEAHLEVLPRGTITVLFGAGHMPDVERRLVAKGWARVKTSWYSAWTY